MRYKVTSTDQVKSPHGNNKIWRYFGIDKFVDLVLNKEIHLTKTSDLTDANEARIPNDIEKSIISKYIKSGMTIRDAHEEFASKYGWYELYRNGTSVNCWSIDRDESYALWKIYLGGAKSGIAIQSTVSSLRRSINNKNKEHSDKKHYPCYIGEVDYTNGIDINRINRLKLVCTKRTFYSYEREARLIVLDYPKSEGGEDLLYPIRIGVDIDELIHSIYVSPFSGNWLGSLVKKLLRELHPSLESRVVSSRILDV
ncbi:hypothetical protein [Paramagnetospirillum marisnigri]|uniref:hypothetical protein n=1 Tax=Paramagnetospirillum marisnigri TaxID=1285242 RepID=UPI000A5234F3|nr:hypothetical protein [Paramagnetospirillum marisnigri]